MGSTLVIQKTVEQLVVQTTGETLVVDTVEEMLQVQDGASLSNLTPLTDSDFAETPPPGPGTRTTAARSDHVHPTNIILPVNRQDRYKVVTSSNYVITTERFISWSPDLTGYTSITMPSETAGTAKLGDEVTFLNFNFNGFGQDGSGNPVIAPTILPDPDSPDYIFGTPYGWQMLQYSDMVTLIYEADTAGNNQWFPKTSNSRVSVNSVPFLIAPIANQGQSGGPPGIIVPPWFVPGPRREVMFFGLQLINPLPTGQSLFYEIYNGQDGGFYGITLAGPSVGSFAWDPPNYNHQTTPPSAPGFGGAYFYAKISTPAGWNIPNIGTFHTTCY